MTKKEYSFLNPVSSCIAFELQRYDHIREDQEFYRDMKMNSLLRIRSLLNDEIKNRAVFNHFKNLEEND